MIDVDANLKKRDEMIEKAKSQEGEQNAASDEVASVAGSNCKVDD